MIDWGLVLVIIFGLLGGIQFFARFIAEPLVKKQKGEDYKFNKILVVFTIMYLLFMSIGLFLAIGGYFTYVE